MIENATPKFKVPIENGTEQKHMFSAWEKCLGEIKNNPEDIRFKLQYDDVGNLKAPNGEVSEYNKYRQKDGAGNFIKPEDENDDPALLLAKVVRSKVFMSGDEKTEWSGFGDWRVADKAVSLQKRNSKTGEPVVYLHGTKKIIPTNEGLKPGIGFDRSVPEIWFSTKRHVAGAYAFDVLSRKSNAVYQSFLRINKVMTMYSPDTEEIYPVGTARLSPNLETAVLYNTEDVFHIPPNLVQII